MSIFSSFRGGGRQSDGDDEERRRGGQQSGHPSHLMRCMTLGCVQPILEPGEFCAVCSSRRMALMLFDDDDLEGWPLKPARERLTLPTLPAIPAMPAFPPLPALDQRLNAAGDEALIELQPTCRWCMFVDGEETREPVMARWIDANPVSIVEPCQMHQRIERLWWTTHQR